jgi:prephenate dehydrogenase
MWRRWLWWPIKNHNKMSILSFILSSEENLELAVQIKKKNENINLECFSLEQNLDVKIKESKVFNKIHKNLKEFSTHDIIFLDSLVKFRENIINRLIENNSKEKLIIDLSPAKNDSINWANTNINDENISFISAHPIVNLNYKLTKLDSMFTEQQFLVMPSKNVQERFFNVLIQIIESIDMEPYFIEPVEYDSYYAATNVIPKLLSYSIMKYSEQSNSWAEMSKLAKSEFNYSTIGSLTDPEELYEIITRTSDLSNHWFKEVSNEISQLSDSFQKKDNNLLDYLIKGWESRMKWELGVTGSSDGSTSSVNILNSGQTMAGFLVSENIIQKRVDLEKSKSKDLWKYKRTK